MSQRVIGLDIGTHAVRAAELRLGRSGAVTLSKFGQVALPQGVVSGGEVVDPGRLAEAIKRLWKEVRFTSRKVIVGVGNHRVIVRPAEMPAMGEDDLRSAVELQAAQLIPIPLEQVVLDYQVLERFVDSNGDDTMRVLMVAAQNDVVRTLLSAIELAGLSPTLVDLMPFALLRSLADVTGFDDLENGRQTAEAIVSIGGGVTTVVVHEMGVPKFVRMLMRGGESITEKIASDLSVSFDVAEGLKRQAAAGVTDGPAAEAAAASSGDVARFVEEIKSSLDFYSHQSESAPLSRVVLTGGGARTPGVLAGLADAMGIPVQMGAPFDRLEVSKTGLTEIQLREAEDLSSVAIGLALAGRAVDRGARRLSLLPPDVNERNRVRQQGVLAAAAVVVLLAGLGFLWVQRKSDIDSVRDDVANTRQLLSQRQAELAELGYLREIESAFDTRQATVAAALARDVSWAKLIQEVATVLPDDVWLDSFQGSSPDGVNTPGTFKVDGQGANHTSSARWILRIDALQSISNLWLPSSVRNDDIDDGEGGTVVRFSSDAVLTEDALSRRLDRYIGELLPGAPEPADGPAVVAGDADSGVPGTTEPAEPTDSSSDGRGL